MQGEKLRAEKVQAEVRSLSETAGGHGLDFVVRSLLISSSCDELFQTREGIGGGMISRCRVQLE